MNTFYSALSYIGTNEIIFVIYVLSIIIFLAKIYRSINGNGIIIITIFIYCSIFTIKTKYYIPDNNINSSVKIEQAQPLHAAYRQSATIVEQNALIAPKTIVFVIIESGGQFRYRTDQGEEISLAEMIARKDGNNKHWVIFQNAVTNSSASDVSIPSLFTGTGIDEGGDKLHKMPRLSDMAMVKGYERAFFSSWQMQWSNFDQFFLEAGGFDIFKHASNFDLPPINDAGIDDGAIVKSFDAYINQQPSDKKLFITLGLNALHVPFQDKSMLEIPNSIRGRHARAMYLTALVHEKVFDSLKKSGRYDDALIVIVGDHGENFGTDQKNPFLGRIFDLDDPVLKVTHLMKLPNTTNPAIKTALQSNEKSLVANLDIAPTFAALIGVGLKQGLYWRGHNLLHIIPDDRLSLAANVTDWRQHPMTALALVRSGEKMVCNSSSGCEFKAVSSSDMNMSDVERQRKLNAYLEEASKINVIKDNLISIQNRMKPKNNNTAFIQQE